MEMEKVNHFINAVQEELKIFLAGINREELSATMSVIREIKNNKGRVHVTGVGKPGHVAEYIAALNSSIGTPSYFLDATEAVHGSAGQVLPGDVVIAISNSGETEELKTTVTALKKLGVKLVGVSGGSSSWLKENVDAFLFAGVRQEGDDLNKPPRISILAEIIILQCVSILLQDEEQIDSSKYYLWHPGGALGSSIKNTIGDVAL